MHIFKPTTSTLFFWFFISVTFSIFSQNEIESCGTIISETSKNYISSSSTQIKKYENDYFQKKFAKSNSNSKSINSIPIKAHVIRNSNGTGGICEADLNKAISNLNIIYADAFMEFFLCDGIDYINIDALCNFEKGDEKNLIETNNVSGLINIYFTEYIKNDAEESICGYSDNEGRNDIIVMKNSCATNDSSLVHEIGHFFSLMHTHGLDTIKKTTELVDGSNCDTDGDGICDTPADPRLTNNNVNNFCNYTGTEIDANGDAYKPDTGNMMSYSKKGCRTHFSQQQLARMYAFYQTAKNYLVCPSFNANVDLDNSETCSDELTVNFSNNTVNATKWEWDIDNDGIIDYTEQNPSHIFTNGVYDVTLTISNKSKTIKKTYPKLIKVGILETLLNEDFEYSNLLTDYNWTVRDVSGNGYNWLLNKGKTTSDNTGPILEKTSNNKANTYIYAEASGAKIGDITELISPCINVINPNSELEFAYHMFGKHIGELHVDIKTENGYIEDVIPALVGNQQTNQEQDFLIKSVDLSSYVNETINIRFRAIRGSSWDGDIAIDNIFIKTIDLPISDTNVIVYPNPVTNNFLYIKSNDVEEELTFKISNLSGRLCSSGKVTNQPINVSELSSGMYLLTIIGKDSRITKKIIK
jgi:PKD repeat protein